MDQYKQDSVAIKKNKSQEDDAFGSSIKILESRISQQDLLLENLQKEIKRLKAKIDRHANYLNQEHRG